MAPSTLTELFDRADRMPREGGSWLLEAAELSEAVGLAVLSDPVQLEAVRGAVRAAADAAGCDLIVGASRVADQIVRGLAAGVAEPSRALLFEVVRITGATIAQALAELRHVDVVPAVLLDLHPTPELNGGSPVSITLPEVSRR
jgi:hypothetical protein